MLQQFSSFRETLNPCVVVPAFLTLANLTAVSSKEKMQDLAFKHTTCKSTRLQMGYFSSYGNGVGHIVWEVTDHPIAIIYSHQQVSKVTVTQLTPPAHFGFLGAESHTKEQGLGTNIYMQQGKKHFFA